MSGLVLIGSGETAPTMVKLHRRVLGDLPEDAPAVLLDTPFGFQMNADDLVEKTCGYFADSVGRRVEVASWRRADAPVVEREKALATLARAEWAFAGPGSPTYALRQWHGTPIPQALVDVAHRGGILVFGSAAACTIGTHAIPVYEIYKVGEEPFWAPAMDLLGRLTGLHAVVIPHYDNAEGGGHDTRYCYLGEQRLSMLETRLPDDLGVLGVDEHTALLIDLERRIAEVAGSGTVTVRRRGTSTTVPSGEQVPLDVLDGMLRGLRTTGPTPTAPAPPAGSTAAEASADTAAGAADPRTQGARTSLRAEATAAREAFDDAERRRDLDGCVTAVLDLESAIVAWSADTLQSDDADFARRVLRALVVRLGELARDGIRDPHEVVGEYVDLLLQVREQARLSRDYATSDLIRDGLTGAGVEVRDTPDGTRWVLREPKLAGQGRATGSVDD
jgi:hypothetical protein